MIEDGKPAHWPKMRSGSDSGGEQSAVRVLAEVRRMIVAYRKRIDQDWRQHHAETAPLVDVVGGLIADAEAINMLHEQELRANTPLREKVEKLRDELAESKRPFSAQMEMQNRRIIALTAELDVLRLGIKP